MRDVVDVLATEHPALHGNGTKAWLASTGTLRLLEGLLRPGQQTLETGTGASTVVFAAAGTDHVAISPAADEHRRIVEWCAQAGIDSSRVRFCAEPSDSSSALLTDERLDVVFIDGLHAFPGPIVDWHYTAKRLVVGGVMVIDDVPIPGIRLLYDHMNSGAEWERLAVVDGRAAAFRKLAEPLGGDPWRHQTINRGYPDFSFLSPRERMKASAGAKRMRARTLGSRIKRSLLDDPFR